MQVLGVATHGVSPENARRFLALHPVQFPVLLDHGRDTYNAYAALIPPGISAPFPREVVIGPDGKVAAAQATYRPGVLEALLDRLSRPTP